MVEIVKFLCSYGGKILPRLQDGKLRYTGGETRVVAVDRSISFQELVSKFGNLSGSAVGLRCQLPKYDLDALVSVTSDEDLANIIEEYDLASKVSGSPLKIRVLLWPLKSTKKLISASPVSSPTYMTTPKPVYRSRIAPIPAPILFGVSGDCGRVARRKPCYYTGVSHLKQSRFVHTGNHWQ